MSNPCSLAGLRWRRKGPALPNEAHLIRFLDGFPQPPPEVFDHGSSTSRMQPAGCRRARHDRDAGQLRGPRRRSWNPAPIAVPLLGSTGAGSPDPSRISAGAARRAHATQSDSGDAPQRHASVSRGSRSCSSCTTGRATCSWPTRAAAARCRAASITFTSSGGAALPDNPVPGPFGAASNHHHPVALWRRAHVAFAGAARPVRALADLPQHRGETGTRT